MNYHVNTKHPVDVHVGQRIQQRRKQCNLSICELATQADSTAEDIRRFERGSKRLGSSLLYHISKVLDVPVGYFFEAFSPNSRNLSVTILHPIEKESA